MDPRTLAAMSNQEIRDAFPLPLSAGAIGFLCDTMRGSEWDPEAKAYVSLVDSGKQAVIADMLLCAYPAAPDGLKKLIVDGIREGIDGYWICFSEFTDILVSHRGNPCADALVMTSVRRLTFCEDLLKSMIEAEIVEPVWVSEIRRRLGTKQFVDDADVVESTFENCVRLLAQADANREKPQAR